NDNEIVLDNGDKFTPASFLRWVKRNEVEKKSADAEAEKATRFMEEGEEKEKEKEDIHKETEAANTKRVKNGGELPEGAVMASTEEPAGHSASYLQRLWHSTTFLSLADL